MGTIDGMLILLLNYPNLSHYSVCEKLYAAKHEHEIINQMEDNCQ